MKKILISVSVLLSIACRMAAADSQTNEWGEVACDTQISLNLENAGIEIKTNQDFKISFSIKNLSTNDTFSLMLANGITNSPGISFLIVSPSGSKHLITPPKRDRFSGHNCTGVRPGQTETPDFNSNGLYDFSDPGIYGIQIKITRWFPGQTNHCEIASNVLNVQIN